MTVTLERAAHACRVDAPTSKSAAHRALICAAFAGAESDLLLQSSCEDIDATVRCLNALGARITPTEGGLHVCPADRKRPLKGAVLDCGESGSTLRFLLPVCGAIGADVTFLRRGRLPERPLGPLADELRRKGMILTENGEKLAVRGSIAPGAYTVAANISSQYVTGLLLALSLLDGPSTLTLTGKIESAPYIAMTAEALALCGAPPRCTANGAQYEIAGYAAQPWCAPTRICPEGDFSGAAFPLAVGAVSTQPVTVTGLSLPSLQGDSEILEILTRFGAKVKKTADGITVSPAPMRGVEIDAAQIPDLVPILAVVAAAAAGETRIYGAERLRLKESDRLVAVTDLLKTLGADVTETPDGLIIRGGKPLHGGVVNAYGDHRIAMSAAVASLLTDEAVTIPHAECVGKSYPAFFDEVITPTSREGA